MMRYDPITDSNVQNVASNAYRSMCDVSGAECTAFESFVALAGGSILWVRLSVEEARLDKSPHPEP